MSTRLETVDFRMVAGVRLVDVAVSRCANCDEHEVSIPCMDKLVSALSLSVNPKTARFEGDTWIVSPEIV